MVILHTLRQYLNRFYLTNFDFIVIELVGVQLTYSVTNTTILVIRYVISLTCNVVCQYVSQNLRKQKIYTQTTKLLKNQFNCGGTGMTVGARTGIHFHNSC